MKNHIPNIRRLIVRGNLNPYVGRAYMAYEEGLVFGAGNGENRMAMHFFYIV